jgi:hypothetical protein
MRDADGACYGAQGKTLNAIAFNYFLCRRKDGQAKIAMVILLPGVRMSFCHP